MLGHDERMGNTMGTSTRLPVRVPARVRLRPPVRLRPRSNRLGVHLEMGRESVDFRNRLGVHLEMGRESVSPAVLRGGGAALSLRVRAQRR